MRWPKACLGDVAQVVSGATPKSSVDHYWDGDIPWITPADLSKLEGKEVSATSRRITQAGLSSCSSRILPPRSVLFSSRAPIGHVAINTVPMATNQGFKSFVPDHKILSSDFLYWWLKSNKEYLQSLGRGATFKEVSKEIVESIEIPLPPLEEQRRIAAILDKASRIGGLCGVAHKLSQASEKSLFLHFFAGYPEGSDFLLEELTEKRPNAIRTGPFGSQLLHSEFTDSGVAVLGIDNAVNNSFEWGKRRFISHEKYEQLKRYTVYSGDLLITIMGTCGRAAVVPDDIPQAINTKHLCAISIDRRVVLPDFLHSYILFHPSTSLYLGQRTKGAIMEGLNMAIIKEMPVAVPPMSQQLDWLKQRTIVRSVCKRTQAMSASALSLGHSLSHNFLEGRAA